MSNDKENKRSNEDIRRYLSPHTPQSQGTRRRRRVISSDSEHDDDIRPAVQQMPLSINNASETLHRSQQNQDFVQLSSSSSNSDDSMYIAMPRHRDQPQLPVQRQSSNIQKGGAAAKKKERKNNALKSNANSERCERSSQRVRSHAYNGQHHFVAEAEEANSDDTADDSNECIESDINGVDLYCQAVSSLRSANNARNQLRAATANCRVCAKFAAFLQHFL